MARKRKDEPEDEEDVSGGEQGETEGDDLDEAGFHVDEGEDGGGPEKGLDSDGDEEYVRGPKKRPRKRPGVRLLDDYEDHLEDEDEDEEGADGDREGADLDDEDDEDEEADGEDEDEDEDEFDDDGEDDED